MKYDDDDDAEFQVKGNGKSKCAKGWSRAQTVDGRLQTADSRQQANSQTRDWEGWKKGQGKCETHATTSMTITNQQQQRQLQRKKNMKKKKKEMQTKTKRNENSPRRWLMLYEYSYYSSIRVFEHSYSPF